MTSYLKRELDLQKHQRLIEIIEIEALRIYQLVDSGYKQKEIEKLDFLIELQSIKAKEL